MKSVGAHLVVMLTVAMLISCAAPPKPVPVPVPAPKPVVKPPPERPPSVGPLGSGKLYGTVAAAGGKELPGAVTLAVRGRYTESNGEGAYVLTGLPAGKFTVVAEARGGGARYLALPSVILNENEEKQLDVELRDATDIDRYCLECHPPLGKRTNPRQIIRDAHPSGVKPRKKMRTGKLLDERGYVTCESCHTLHEETETAHHVIYSYENGELCNLCH